MKPPPRLARVLALRKICSRREADRLIKQGLVLVDGRVAVSGERVDGSVPLEKLRIELKAEANARVFTQRTILFNKPVGVLSVPLGAKTFEQRNNPRIYHEDSAKDFLVESNFVGPQGGNASTSSNLIDWEKFDKHTFATAGRLDKESSGLLVLTENGLLASQLLNGSVEKEYHVTYSVVPKPLFMQHSRVSQARLEEIYHWSPERKLEYLSSGEIEMDGRPLLPCKIQRTDSSAVTVILKEGRNRQIRRMFTTVGWNVKFLQRTRIGEFQLYENDIPEACWRFLLPHESFFK